MPDVWLVVVNWNGAELLPACLAALRRAAPAARVVVADNGSTDGSAEVVAGFPGVEWLPLGENRGFAEANNVVLRRALAEGARWIGLVNPDVRVERDWLDRLVATGEAAPEAGLIQGLLLFEDRPDVVNSTGLVVDALGRARDRDFEVPLARLDRADGPVTGATGGAVLLRGDMLREVGLFDPEFFAYCEDVDLSLRAARAGWRSWYVGGARAYHGYEKSFGPGSPRKKYLLARNHLRVAAAHLPVPLAIAVVPTVAALRALVKAPLELLAGRPRHAVAELTAARDGAAAAARALLRRARLSRAAGGGACGPAPARRGRRRRR